MRASRTQMASAENLKCKHSKSEIRATQERSAPARLAVSSAEVSCLPALHLMQN